MNNLTFMYWNLLIGTASVKQGENVDEIRTNEHNYFTFSVYF